MDSAKRYGRERNRAFNEQRTAEDIRAYRKLMRQFRAERWKSETYDAALGARWDAYFDALLSHGNKAASFPSFEDWSAKRLAQQTGRLDA